MAGCGSKRQTIKEKLKRKDFLILLLCFCLAFLLERLGEKEIRKGSEWVVVRTSESVVQEGKIETSLSWIAKVERGRLKRALTSGPRAQSVEESKSF